MTRFTWTAISALLLGAALAAPALAEKKYDPGASDSEIKIGQTNPLSGPASAFGNIGKAEAAYIRMINEQGGVNGRKINLIQYDDAYSPPKTVEQVRRLVEDDEVLTTFQIIGTPPNSAVQKYLNTKGVPQLLAGSGASRFTDPKNFPWTISANPNYQSEAHIYAKYILENYPNAKIGILYQNDDLGKDYVKGLKDGLGPKAGMIVKEVSYELSDPTIDSQIVTLKASGADLFYDMSTPKFAAQAIRKSFEIGWRPMTFLSNVAVWISTVMEPAGVEAGTGILSTAYVKDPDDPAWKDDPGVKAWRDFMTKYVPEADQHDTNYVNAYNSAMALEAVLKACGDDLSTENILKQAYSIHDLELPMLLPGIKINTSATDHVPVDQMQFMRFNGKTWERFGELQTGN